MISNDALRHALADARLRETDVAAALGVAPKTTVQRWLAGRVPNPGYHRAVADLVQTRRTPALARRGRLRRARMPGDQGEQLSHRTAPHRSAVPPDAWRRLFAGAEQEIGIPVYAVLFLAEDVELVRLLVDRARAEVVVLLLLGGPDSSRVGEEGIGAAVAARVQKRARPVPAATGRRRGAKPVSVRPCTPTRSSAPMTRC